VRDWEDDEDWTPAWKRVLVGLLVAAVFGGLGYLVWTMFAGGESQPQRQVINTVTRVTLPPPPPPPPPPKADPPPEPEQPRMREPESKPLERIEPKPQAPPTPGPAPQQLGLAPGPGGANPYGIGAGGDGTIGGGGSGGTGGGSSRFSGYVADVQAAIQAALQRDGRTNRGTWRLPARVWLTAAGEIHRAQLVGTTGNQARDSAVQQVLLGLRVTPPPADMPQPVVLRINARPS
jgi:hypothetical protein